MRRTSGAGETNRNRSSGSLRRLWNSTKNLLHRRGGEDPPHLPQRDSLTRVYSAPAALQALSRPKGPFEIIEAPNRQRLEDIQKNIFKNKEEEISELISIENNIINFIEKYIDSIYEFQKLNSPEIKDDSPEQSSFVQSSFVSLRASFKAFLRYKNNESLEEVKEAPQEEKTIEEEDNRNISEDPNKDFLETLTQMKALLEENKGEDDEIEQKTICFKDIFPLSRKICREMNSFVERERSKTPYSQICNFEKLISSHRQEIKNLMTEERECCQKIERNDDKIQKIEMVLRNISNEEEGIDQEKIQQAMCDIGYWFRYGNKEIGLNTDPRISAQLYQKAAALGSERAMNNLSDMYREEKGVFSSQEKQAYNSALKSHSIFN